MIKQEQIILNNILELTERKLMGISLFARKIEAIRAEEKLGVIKWMKKRPRKGMFAGEK